LRNIPLNTAQGTTHTRVLSEYSSGSDGSEGKKRERQMKMLLLTKQKLVLTLELQRIQRQTVAQGQHQKPMNGMDWLASARRPTVLCVLAPPAERDDPCKGCDSLEEADDLTSAAPTRQTSDDVDLDKSFWNLHSLPHVHLRSTMPSHDVLPPSAVESLIVKGRVGVLPPDTRTQIRTALLAVMKRKGKLDLVQGLSVE